MKKALVILIVFFTLSMPAWSFDWQIQFLKEKTWESLPINEIIKMENGSEFRLVVQADSDSYCYVIGYDSERKIHVLHNKVLRKGTELNLGPFMLTNPPGTEFFFVIMSNLKQANLEKLIEKHNANQNSRQHTNNLYREVVNLQNNVSRLGEPASVIIPSGGTSRTANKEQNFSTKFTGKDIYVRSITIRH